MKTPPPSTHRRWIELQTELRDLAFGLDLRSNPVAADLAVTIATRIGELIGEETETETETASVSATGRSASRS